MAIINDLLPGDFRGVRFLIQRAETTGGRKSVIHEFPNTDTQTVEDLGLIPRRFTVGAILSGDQYFSTRNELIDALETAGVGVLNHPLYGRIDDAVLISYSIDENLSALGDGSIRMEFQINNNTGIPEKAENTLPELFQRVEELTESVQGYINEAYTFVSGQINLISDSITTVDNFLRLTEDVALKRQAIADEFTRLTNGFLRIARNINEVATTPAILAATSVSLLTESSDLYASKSDQSSFYDGLYILGDERIPLQPTTADRIERQKNRDVFNDSLQSTALALSYLAAVEIDFLTETEIDNKQAILDNQYFALIDRQNINNDTIQALNEVRDKASQLFDELRLSVRRVVDLKTTVLPVSVISYQLYGNVDDASNLITLNNNANTPFFEGDIRVLSI